MTGHASSRLAPAATTAAASSRWAAPRACIWASRRIEVRSEVGKGSAFRLWLPLKKAESPDEPISVAEAALHPMRSVLTEAVGAKEMITVETHDIDLIHGDRMMLTSDGAHGVIDEDSLRELLNRGADLKTTVESIIAGARERGGPDNVSCIIVEYRDKEHGA